MNEFGLRWIEAGGRDARLTVKEKTFRTRTARDHYADLVAEKANFIRFEAWLDPPADSAADKTTVTPDEYDAMP